jgi:hypothetical protein
MMARNRCHVTWLRLGVAMASWALALAVAQEVLGADVGRSARELEQRIELRFKAPEAAPDRAPARSHDEESLEPWELVGV